MGKPNIVLVTADSVRADWCFDSFGGHRTTPNLEQFASDGIRFETAISPGPRTPVAVPEFLTGAYMPFETVEGREHRFQLIKHMITKHETLPERLANVGYNTAAVSANPYTTTKVDFSSIFDIFYAEGEYESPRSVMMVPNYTARKVMNLLNQYRNNLHWFATWPTFYDDVSSALDELEEPYFLWIFLLDTHNPYIAPRADRKESSTVGMYEGMVRSNQLNARGPTETYFRNSLPEGVETKIKAAYRDTIRSVDRFLDRLLTDLRETDAVLIFNADHGEAFNEHGTYGHQSELYEENVHVPLVVYNSGSASDVAAPVSLRSLPEMVTEYVTNGTPFDHRKWQPEFVVARDEDGGFAIRDDEWKYIARDGEELLFHIASDPGETIDHSGVETEIRDAMNERLVDIVASIDTEVDTRLEGGVDQELVERLESLGYVEE